MPGKLRPLRGRLIGLAAGLGVIAIVLLTTASLLFRAPEPSELSFASPAGGAGRPLQIYAEIVSVDPVRDAMELRLDFATESDRLGVRYSAPADRDMLIEAGDGDRQQEVSLRRGQRMESVTIAANLNDGEINDYPYDRYTTALTVAAYEMTDGSRGPPIPLQVTLWRRLAGWTIAVNSEPSVHDPLGLTLAFSAGRTRLQMMVATVLYSAMALLALVALTITTLLYLGVRRVDTTLAAVQATMVFTLPGVRNMMPGGPPVGVLGDNLVLFGAEVVVVLCLLVTVITWACRGDGR